MSQFWKNQLRTGNYVVEGQIQVLDKNTLMTPLPPNFEWCTLDVFNKQTLNMIYHFLKNNYVEDSKHMFQLEYSEDFLKWILTCPNYNQSLHIGLMYKLDDKMFLVGFITGTNTNVYINGSGTYRIAEINFLCIDKSLRNNNIAPLLITEITRRVVLTNTQYALYTVSKKLPYFNSFSECHYYNYYINIRKLKECRFIHNIKFDLNQICDFSYNYKNTRHMVYADSNKVCILLNGYLRKFKIYRFFSLEEICHYFLPKENIVYTNVIEDDDRNIIGMYSIVNIKSKLLFKNLHEYINMCYLHYYAYNTAKINIENLMIDIIRFAKKNDFDCLNVLNNLDNNNDILQKLNFYENASKLNYYLYNYNMKTKMLSNDIGVNLL